MFRLIVLLAVGLFLTLLIAGADRGQLRPGLAQAVASGEQIVILEPLATSVPVVEAAEQPPSAPDLGPAVEIADAPAIGSYDAPLAAADPAAPAPAATPLTPAPEPVFSLSTLPTTRMTPAAAPIEQPTEDPFANTGAPETSLPPSGDVWYVTAEMVNVREGPNTDSSVIDKLVMGEAVMVSFAEGSEWAKVQIEGDGLAGYVAMRFLSPTAP
ncbi:SH3 domain-containing protein [Xinfangfangia sp. CPCC 101601]|uniref:SH3 domain-containing protein n=1 Tax=Pseudogemmobacter lacusdianii TaxID=3069608 RepID=A0ABU0VXB1_9RHOB|nr:SH3 domain-containing protein [Xinfangfangia sp. CPCC 101601]MDQ2066399.1 SH3 domain-containing protein [Xinfangfangia sp. CPCC 101601]